MRSALRHTIGHLSSMRACLDRGARAPHTTAWCLSSSTATQQCGLSRRFFDTGMSSKLRQQGQRRFAIVVRLYMSRISKHRPLTPADPTGLCLRPPCAHQGTSGRGPPLTSGSELEIFRPPTNEVIGFLPSCFQTQAGCPSCSECTHRPHSSSFLGFIFRNL